MNCFWYSDWWGVLHFRSDRAFFIFKLTNYRTDGARNFELICMHVFQSIESNRLTTRFICSDWRKTADRPIRKCAVQTDRRRFELTRFRSDRFSVQIRPRWNQVPDLPFTFAVSLIHATHRVGTICLDRFTMQIPSSTSVPIIAIIIIIIEPFSDIFDQKKSWQNFGNLVLYM